MRSDVRDEEWAIIGGLPPPERGRWLRPAQDNRLFLNGMLYVLRVGCPGGHIRRALVEVVAEHHAAARRSRGARVCR